MGKVYPCSHGTYLHSCEEQDVQANAAIEAKRRMTLVIEQLARVRDTGETNMMSIHGVQDVANKHGWSALVLWIADHRGDYATMLEALRESAQISVHIDDTTSSGRLE